MWSSPLICRRRGLVGLTLIIGVLIAKVIRLPPVSSWTLLLDERRDLVVVQNGVDRISAFQDSDERRGVAAEHAMGPELPEIAQPRDGIGLGLGDGVLVRAAGNCREKTIEIRRVEAGDFEVAPDIELGQLAEFEGEELSIPPSQLSQAVVSEPKCTNLHLGQVLQSPPNFSHRERRVSEP